MLSKQNRLSKKRDFDRVFKGGISIKDGFLILKTLLNKSEESRFAFVVSKKVSKKAVVRNLLRRRMASIVEKNFKSLGPGSDNIFIALPGLEEQGFKNMEDAVVKLLKKAKILK